MTLSLLVSRLTESMCLEEVLSYFYQVPPLMAGGVFSKNCICEPSVASDSYLNTSIIWYT